MAPKRSSRGKRSSRPGSRRSSRPHGDAQQLHWFAVDVDKDTMGLEYMTRAGKVRLPLRAHPMDIEHALAPLGIYVPKGADRVIWSKSGAASGKPAAVIRDSSGHAMVLLWRLPERR